jgi:probable HAF family extracellular repeat protein
LGVLREGDRQPGLSTALAINEAGQVVGYSYALDNSDFYMRAFIWNGSTMIDLNSLMAVDTVSEDWHLTSATGINDNGWVVGEAYNSNLNEYHAYLLTPIPVAPVPEPETYALFMAGLGLMGFIARRRKNDQA